MPAAFTFTRFQEHLKFDNNNNNNNSNSNSNKSNNSNNNSNGTTAHSAYVTLHNDVSYSFQLCTRNHDFIGQLNYFCSNIFTDFFSRKNTLL